MGLFADFPGSILIVIVLFLIVIALLQTFFTVQQQSCAIVEQFGRYVRTARPGLNVKIPFMEYVAQRVSLRVQQLLVEIETKTADNVFVKVLVAIQYRVASGSESVSYYQLSNHEEQIRSYVLDVVRAKVPRMNLDEVFEKKDDIGTAVKTELDAAMKVYGFEIPSALVTDVNPADNVKAAMNEINTQQRLQVAANAKGEANKILVVKAAEAEAESKRLQGEGIAKQRRAIVDGLRESITAFKAEVGSVSEHEVLNLVLLTQYFDTMKEIGVSSGSKVILLPHSPEGMSDVSAQLRNAILTANEASDAGKK
ncbi:regulator of protease activity HflC (stomatin/prohibitin superfamily) [Rhizomicrobium palustre]|uniref:Regulator of protease activity HflC (Stomatin/prohibitin superfamily) n=1 Tax=Rhizomicrobium palustre TaxID=189966 RepID=A0A846N1D3_9PROT|nr:SPFH domain-containing protein [Rhizomicrobium palustre]NIK89275.1 regulator of protease activity HflC (stomatin/prohibitin superfamily) [Rhizomicrobium palustre]